MAIFPKIQSPCPYKGELSAIMDGDVCRLCKRQVIDLSEFTDNAKLAFLRACEEEVCVSYKLPFRPALAAAITAAVLGAPMAALAQDMEFEDEIIVGGISDPANVEYITDSRDDSAPELPVIYDDIATSTAFVSAPGAEHKEAAAVAVDRSVQVSGTDLTYSVKAE
jgi:hypothetical protein